MKDLFLEGIPGLLKGKSTQENEEAARESGGQGLF